jgi:hypothetical protein
MNRDFLVYEHWRPDTNACFYVGKGKLKRSRSIEARNGRHARIVAKLRRMGYEPESRIVGSGLTEPEAFALEIERIAFWRRAGTRTANFTDGGDGTSGKFHSPETRARIAAKAIGRVLSAESIAKRTAKILGTKRSTETRAKQSASAKLVQSASRKAVCATHAGKLAMLKMSRSAANDPAVRKTRSLNAKALWADPEYRAKVLAARAASRRCVSIPVIPGFD